MKTMAIENEAALDAMLLYGLGKSNASAELLPVVKNRVKVNKLEDGRCEATFDLDESVTYPIAAVIDQALVAVGFKPVKPEPDKKDDEKPPVNPWMKETFNLTDQMQIRGENSVLADRMQAEANATKKPEPRRLYHGVEM